MVILWLRVDFPEPEMTQVFITVLWFASLALSKMSRIWGGRGMLLLLPSDGGAMFVFALLNLV